ncbi:MAG: hypothetical protein KDD56_10395, partial [Bdellovibrionales bacterium]|nr:hypothetical protein [Bdellovibrionales bacterium]
MTANKVFQTITTCVEVDRSLPPSSTPLNYEQRLKKQVLKSDAEKSEEKLQVFADKLVLAAKKRAWRKVASLLDVLERVRGKLNGNQGVSSII